VLKSEHREHGSPPMPPCRADATGRGGRPSIDMLVGRAIRSKRLTLGLTENDVAQAIHMPPEWVRAYERGAERILPKHLLQVATLFRVKVGDFFGDVLA